MRRDAHIGPLLPPGPNQEQRTVPVTHLRRRTLLCSAPQNVARGAFTLVELLTVITIIAILATLLMTTLSSVKRKAREAVCTSNLRQIGLALNLYLEDFDARPASLSMLAGAKYLGDGKVLVCPADRSGGVSEVSDLKSFVTSGSVADTRNVPAALPVSYQHPLGWNDEDWNRLMRAQTRAGVVVCTFHDIARAREATLAGPVSEGLILRGQLDGTVVRRHIFGSTTAQEGAAPPADRGQAPAVTFGPTDNSQGSASQPSWEFFSDEPPQ